MDKLAIVIDNYIDAECDANTTPRQAYERGFRRAYKKCETVMHSRKIEKEKASIENDRLKAENAKLREYITRLEQANIVLSSDNCDLLNDMEDMQFFIAENRKLRELVRDMWRFTGTACKKYPRLFDPAAQGGQMVQLNMIDAFEQRIRELGIEVSK